MGGGRPPINCSGWGKCSENVPTTAWVNIVNPSTTDTKRRQSGLNNIFPGLGRAMDT